MKKHVMLSVLGFRYKDTNGIIIKRGICILVITLICLSAGALLLSNKQTSDCYVGRVLTELSENEIIRYESINNLKARWLLLKLQYAYTQQYQWYYPYSLNFTFYVKDERYDLDMDNLERVTFFQDKENGSYYFVPSDGRIMEFLNRAGEEKMFIFKLFETKPRRVITPQPDPVHYCIYNTNVTDIKDRLIEIGTAEMEFPDADTIERRGWTDNTLMENEYTQAVTDMIHGTLIGEQYYGNYEIYIAEYFMTNDVGTHEKEFDGIAVGISAAVVCLDDGYGYCCNFRASDQLIDGEVRIYYSLPDTANAWEEEIANAMEDRRLVISLEVKPGDEIEVPQSPYPFVMLPILDYAVGEGRFPEGALYSDTMVFY